MSWQRLTIPLTLAILATGCGDRSPVAPNAPGNELRPTVAAPCPTASNIQNQIKALYPDGKPETAALGKFSELQKKLSQGKTADAIAKMFDLVDQTLKLYYAGKLTGGQSATTKGEVATLISSLYCFVGLSAPNISSTTLSTDGAAAVVYPTSGDTLIKTTSGWAEVKIPAGALPGDQPVLVTIQRIPESDFTSPGDPFAGPLTTTLNQYPLFYDYSTSPAVTFAVPVTVAFCLEGTIDLAHPPGSRLRVAHNISPTQIEILPWATPPVLDCSAIQVASAGPATGPALAFGATLPPTLQRGLLRVANWVLPPMLEAAALATTVPGTCCLGGTGTKFSPFGGVDTLGFIGAVSDTFQTAAAGLPVLHPPVVRLTTDPSLGAQPIPGVTVTFKIISGLGSLNGGADSAIVLTDTNGVAALASWVVDTGVNQVVARPSSVARSGFTPEFITFTAAATSSWTAISAGGYYAFSSTCALQGSRAYCWGDNSLGQLGAGAGAPASSPTPLLVSGGIGFKSVSVGGDTALACGLAVGGAAYCWGNNSHGQLGDGTTADSPAPVPAAAGFSFLAVSAGDGHACGIKADTRLAYCWGFGPPGTPLLVEFYQPWLSISTGLHDCGVTGIVPTDTVYCWGGGNEFGQLGNGTTTSSSTPTVPAGPFGSVTAGRNHSCGLQGSTAYCWGANSVGQLGVGSTTGPDDCSPSGPCSTTPAAVAGAGSFTQLSAGWDYTCGVTTTGDAYCWGANFQGQLGDSSTTDRSAPALVKGGHKFMMVSAGVSHSCGLTVSGEAYCWGFNDRGQLGDGTTTGSIVPVKVLTP